MGRESLGGDREARYPIGAVARRTGLSMHVLRAWERRYGVVDPARTDGGVRLYSNEDVLRLRLLRRVTEAGHPIGQVARLETDALLTIAREAEGELEPESGAEVGPEVSAAGRGIEEEAGRFEAAALEAVEALDGKRLQAILMRAVVALTGGAFLEFLAVPLLRRVGELWAAESICPAHERLLSVTMRGVLSWLMDAMPVEAGAPVLLATTPARSRHELGAMLAGVVAAEEGWRVVYLGPDLPAEDIATAAVTTAARVVALSVVYAEEARTLHAELRRLRALLPDGVELVVGGSGAVAEAEGLAGSGGRVLQGLPALRELLRAARPAAGGGSNQVEELR